MILLTSTLFHSPAARPPRATPFRTVFSHNIISYHLRALAFRKHCAPVPVHIISPQPQQCGSFNPHAPHAHTRTHAHAPWTRLRRIASAPPPFRSHQIHPRACVCVCWQRAGKEGRETPTCLRESGFIKYTPTGILNITYHVSGRCTPTCERRLGARWWGGGMGARKCVDVFAGRRCVECTLFTVVYGLRGRRTAPLREANAESEKEVLTKHWCVCAGCRHASWELKERLWRPSRQRRRSGTQRWKWHTADDGCTEWTVTVLVCVCVCGKPVLWRIICTILMHSETNITVKVG